MTKHEKFLRKLYGIILHTNNLNLKILENSNVKIVNKN